MQPDLHPGNILFCIPAVESWTVDNFFENFGAPEKLSRSDFIARGYEIPAQSEHVPEYLVPYPPASKAIVSLCFNSPAVKIIDFGSAFPYTGPNDAVRKLIGPPAPPSPPPKCSSTISSPPRAMCGPSVASSINLSGSKFGRGLARNLSDPSTSSVLLMILRNGSVIAEALAPELLQALKVLHRKAVVYSCQLNCSTEVFVLPSALHRW